MIRKRSWLPIVMAFSIPFATGCSHKAPQLTVTEKQNIEEKSHQTAIDKQTYQINHSNLPPEAKQRLLAQIHSPSGK